MLRWCVFFLFILSVLAWGHAEPGGRYVDNQGRHFIVERELGAGGYGMVFRATDSQTSLPFALKVFYDEAVGKQAETTHALLDKLRKNSPVADRFLPSEVISFQEVDGNPHRWSIALRMPVMEADIHGVVGDLNLAEPRLSGDQLSLRVQLLSLFFDPMLEAWAALDHEGLVHRDFSARNFFLQRNPANTSIFVFLADFDLLDSLDSKKEYTVVGNPLTMAPEVWDSRRFSDLGTESDYFGLAATFFQMMTGETIWANAGVAANVRTLPLLFARGEYSKVYEKAHATLSSLLRLYQARVVGDWRQRERLASKLQAYMEATLVGLTEQRDLRKKRMKENALLQSVRHRVKPRHWLQKLWCGERLAYP